MFSSFNENIYLNITDDVTKELLTVRYMRSILSELQLTTYVHLKLLDIWSLAAALVHIHSKYTFRHLLKTYTPIGPA